MPCWLGADSFQAAPGGFSWASASPSRALTSDVHQSRPKIGTMHMDTAQELGYVIPHLSTHELLRGRSVPSEFETIVEMFEAAAAATPHAIAVEDSSRQCTYSELRETSRRAAKAIAARIGSEGAVVAVHLERSLDLVACALATLMSGNVYLPLSADIHPERLREILCSAEPALVIETPGLSPSAQNVAEGLRVESVSPGELLQSSRTETGRNSGPAATSSDVAYIIYTSGTTGTPKGVPITNAGICNRLEWMRRYYRYGGGDCNLLKTQIGFDVSIVELFFPLSCGARLVLLGEGLERDVDMIARKIRSHEVTWLPISPMHLGHLLDGDRLVDCHALAQVSCGIEAWDFSMVQKFHSKLPGKRLFNGYGPTEASVGVAVWRTDPDYGPKRLTFGGPIDNTDFAIVDRNFRAVTCGATGELLIAGVCLSPGYWRDNWLTSEKYIDILVGGRRTRFYRSGDLVRQLEDGNIEFVGRVDDQVKIRGLRIELGEVRRVVEGLSGIKSAVVLTVFEGERKRIAVQYVNAHPGTHRSASELMADCRRRLMPALVPTLWREVSEHPLTTNGKTDFPRIRQSLERCEQTRAEGTSNRPGYVLEAGEPESALSRLARIWSGMLGEFKPARQTSFFDLGGNSILLLVLVEEIRSEFGVSMDFQELLEASSLDEMSAVVESRISAVQGDRLSERGSARQRKIIPYFFVFRALSNPPPTVRELRSALEPALRSVDERLRHVPCSFEQAQDDCRSLTGEGARIEDEDGIRARVSTSKEYVYLWLTLQRGVLPAYNRLYTRLLRELEPKGFGGVYTRDHAYQARALQLGNDPSAATRLERGDAAKRMDHQLLEIAERVRTCGRATADVPSPARILLPCLKIGRFHPNCGFGIIEALARSRWGAVNHADVVADHRIRYVRQELDTLEPTDGSAQTFIVQNGGEPSEVFSRRLSQTHGLTIGRHPIEENPLGQFVELLRLGSPFMTTFDFKYLRDQRQFGEVTETHPVLVHGIDTRHQCIHAMEQVYGSIQIGFHDYFEFFKDYRGAGKKVEYFELEKSSAERPMQPPEFLKRLTSIAENLSSADVRLGIKALEALHHDLSLYVRRHPGRAFQVSGVWAFSHDLHYLRLLIGQFGATESVRGDGGGLFEELSGQLQRLHGMWFEVDGLFERSLLHKDAKASAHAVEKIGRIVPEERSLLVLLQRLLGSAGWRPQPPAQA